MNKIYKVIYSRVKNCCVVVSELARSAAGGSARQKVRAELAQKVLAGLALGTMFALPALGYAMPQAMDGQRMDATISTGAKTMDITGTEGNGKNVLNWETFNVAADETVNFNGAQSYLNLIHDNLASHIDGKLTGAGSNVYLINPNGVLFGADSVVNLGSGSLYASASKLHGSAWDEYVDGSGALKAVDSANVTGDIACLGDLAANNVYLEGNIVTLTNDIGTIHADVRADNVNFAYATDAEPVTEINRTQYTEADQGKLDNELTTFKDKIGNTITLNHLNSDPFTKAETDSIDGYFLVRNIYEWQNIRNNPNGKYVLGGDIDASLTHQWNGKEFTENDWQNVQEGGSVEYALYDYKGNKLDFNTDDNNGHTYYVGKLVSARVISNESNPNNFESYSTYSSLRLTYAYKKKDGSECYYVIDVGDTSINPNNTEDGLYLYEPPQDYYTGKQYILLEVDSNGCPTDTTKYHGDKSDLTDAEIQAKMKEIYPGVKRVDLWLNGDVGEHYYISNSESEKSDLSVQGITSHPESYINLNNPNNVFIVDGKEITNITDVSNIKQNSEAVKEILAAAVPLTDINITEGAHKSKSYYECNYHIETNIKVKKGDSIQSLPLGCGYVYDLNKEVVNQYNAMFYELPYAPLGTENKAFNGTINGLGYSLKNVYINGTTNANFLEFTQGSGYQDPDGQNWYADKEKVWCDASHVGVIGYLGDGCKVSNLKIDYPDIYVYSTEPSTRILTKGTYTDAYLKLTDDKFKDNSAYALGDVGASHASIENVTATTQDPIYPYVETEYRKMPTIQYIASDYPESGVVEGLPVLSEVVPDEYKDISITKDNIKLCTYTDFNGVTRTALNIIHPSEFDTAKQEYNLIANWKSFNIDDDKAVLFDGGYIGQLPDGLKAYNYLNLVENPVTIGGVIKGGNDLYIVSPNITLTLDSYISTSALYLSTRGINEFNREYVTNNKSAISNGGEPTSFIGNALVVKDGQGTYVTGTDVKEQAANGQKYKDSAKKYTDYTLKGDIINLGQVNTNQTKTGIVFMEGNDVLATNRSLYSSTPERYILTNGGELKIAAADLLYNYAGVHYTSSTVEEAASVSGKQFYDDIDVKGATNRWGAALLNSLYVYNTGSADERTLNKSELYYLVRNAYELQNMQNNPDEQYLLGRDIDASVTKDWNDGAGFAPIFGNKASNYAFTGVFDGNGFKIKNIHIDLPDGEGVGLFSFAQNATLKNVVLEGGSVAGYSNVGALVGSAVGTIVEGTVTGVSVTGSGSENIGGLVGSAEASKVVGSIHNASVKGEDTVSNIGGLVGTATGNSVIIGFTGADTAISAAPQDGGAGGLVGYAEDATVKGYNQGTVSLTEGGSGGSFGGLVGCVGGTTTISGFNLGAVGSVDATNAGGIVGMVDGTADSTILGYNLGNVDGQTKGKLIGTVAENAKATVKGNSKNLEEASGTGAQGAIEFTSWDNVDKSAFRTLDGDVYKNLDWTKPDATMSSMELDIGYGKNPANTWYIDTTGSVKSYPLLNDYFLSSDENSYTLLENPIEDPTQYTYTALKQELKQEALKDELNAKLAELNDKGLNLHYSGDLYVDAAKSDHAEFKDAGNYAITTTWLAPYKFNTKEAIITATIAPRKVKINTDNKVTVDVLKQGTLYTYDLKEAPDLQYAKNNGKISGDPQQGDPTHYENGYYKYTNTPTKTYDGTTDSTYALAMHYGNNLDADPSKNMYAFDYVSVEGDTDAIKAALEKELHPKYGETALVDPRETYGVFDGKDVAFDANQRATNKNIIFDESVKIGGSRGSNYVLDDTLTIEDAAKINQLEVLVMKKAEAADMFNKVYDGTSKVLTDLDLNTLNSSFILQPNDAENYAQKQLLKNVSVVFSGDKTKEFMYNNGNAATNKTIKLDGLTMTLNVVDDNPNNYKISTNNGDCVLPGSGTPQIKNCVISPRELFLDISTAPTSKTYDGTTDVYKEDGTVVTTIADFFTITETNPLKYEGSGSEELDDEVAGLQFNSTPNAFNIKYDDKDAGDDRTIIITMLTNGSWFLNSNSTSNKNFILKGASGIEKGATYTIQGAITPRNITLTRNGTLIDKVYDGTAGTAQKLSGVFTLVDDELTGLSVEAKQALEDTIGTYEDANAGNDKKVIFDIGSNYNVISGSAETAGKINKKDLTLKLVSLDALNREYNGSSFTTDGVGNYYDLVGVVDGEESLVSLGDIYGTYRNNAGNSDANAGDKTVVFDGISLKGAGASNYRLSDSDKTQMVSGIKIAPLKLDLTLKDNAKIQKYYDGKADTAQSLGELFAIGTANWDGLTKETQEWIASFLGTYLNANGEADGSAGMHKPVAFNLGSNYDVTFYGAAGGIFGDIVDPRPISIVDPRPIDISIGSLLANDGETVSQKDRWWLKERLLQAAQKPSKKQFTIEVESMKGLPTTDIYDDGIEHHEQDSND